MALNSPPAIKVSRELARNILNNDQRYVPAPLESEDFKVWAESWSDILLKNREKLGF
jgi:nitrogenase iron protein NifH